MSRHEEPTLDGMPEPPPAWQRPDQGVRMPAVQLDRMLQAALPHVSHDEALPVLAAVHLTVFDGQVESAATDRYSLIRERRLVSQTCDDFRFLLRADDIRSLRVLLKSVLRGLKDEDREQEPVDLALEQTDDGPTLRVLGQDLDVRFTEQPGDFPDYSGMLNRILDVLDTSRRAPFDVVMNPALVARVGPCQSAGRGLTGFRWESAAPVKGKSRPVVVTTTDEDDDVVIALMPQSSDAGEKS